MVLFKEGQTINKNDSLITLESDKSSVEVPSTQSGTISIINVKVGDKVNQGDLILTLKSSEKVMQVKEPVAEMTAKEVDIENPEILWLPRKLVLDGIYNDKFKGLTYATAALIWLLYQDER